MKFCNNKLTSDLSHDLPRLVDGGFLVLDLLLELWGSAEGQLSFGARLAQVVGQGHLVRANVISGHLNRVRFENGKLWGQCDTIIGLL